MSPHPARPRRQERRAFWARASARQSGRPRPYLWLLTLQGTVSGPGDFGAQRSQCVETPGPPKRVGRVSVWRLWFLRRHGARLSHRPKPKLCTPPLPATVSRSAEYEGQWTHGPETAEPPKTVQTRVPARDPPKGRVGQMVLGPQQRCGGLSQACAKPAGVVWRPQDRPGAPRTAGSGGSQGALLHPRQPKRQVDWPALGPARGGSLLSKAHGRPAPTVWAPRDHLAATGFGAGGVT
jgi:hypothetical protein